MVQTNSFVNNASNGHILQNLAILECQSLGVVWWYLLYDGKPQYGETRKYYSIDMKAEHGINKQQEAKSSFLVKKKATYSRL